MLSVIHVDDVFFFAAESVQQSLEKKFGKAGGTIPITPSERFERRMGVSKIDCDICFKFTLRSLFVLHSENAWKVQKPQLFAPSLLVKVSDFQLAA